MDAEEHHCHSSSQRTEESLGLWPSIRSPWVNWCVSSLFRKFSPQRRALMVAFPWSSVDLGRGMGKSRNYRIRITELGNGKGKGFSVKSGPLGCHHQINVVQQTLSQLQGSLPAHLFGKKMQLWLRQHSKSLFGSVLF